MDYVHALNLLIIGTLIKTWFVLVQSIESGKSWRDWVKVHEQSHDADDRRSAVKSRKSDERSQRHSDNIEQGLAAVARLEVLPDRFNRLEKSNNEMARRVARMDGKLDILITRVERM